MKKRTIMRKLISLLLLLAMLAGEFLMPAAKSVLASDGADATAASAGETQAAPAQDQESTGIRQQTVWYWHKGLPPQDGKEYRVLLAWDDKYYMTIDSTMMKYISYHGAEGYYGVSHGYSQVGSSNTEWCSKPGNSYPNGRYHIEVGYPVGRNTSNLLSDLDFDYSVLKSTGSAVSFSLPELPVMKHLAKEKPDTLNGETEDMLADRVLIGIKPTQEMVRNSSTIFAPDETNWLAGYRYMNYKVSTASIMGITYDNTQKRIYHWYLYPINSLTYNRLSQLMEGSQKDLESASSLSDFVTKNENNLKWYVSREGDSYVFTTPGFRTQEGRISYSFDNADELKWLTEKTANLELGHCGNIFASYGNREVYNWIWPSSWSQVDYQTKTKFNFDVYYAEPNLMYFLKSDITVANGQTQNLDGPLVIEEGVKITVKNGGVLSLTDWIVHQGEILIEPGGTMILQQNTTANGYTRNCAVISNNNKQTAAGRVACDGNIIIMPNCTLAAGGIYGFQFGEGAQVANYGQMVSEMWDIYTDYTIEGRHPDSYLYIGYSMNDTGFGLVPEGRHDIYQLKYLTTYQSGVYNCPVDALYNGTRQRFNLQTIVHTPAKRRGRVTG